MQAQEQESRATSLSLWMDEEAAATAAADLIPVDALERHFAEQQPAGEATTPSPTQWAYLHRPVVVSLADCTTGAGA